MIRGVATECDVGGVSRSVGCFHGGKGSPVVEKGDSNPPMIVQDKCLDGQALVVAGFECFAVDDDGRAGRVYRTDWGGGHQESVDESHGPNR